MKAPIHWFRQAGTTAILLALAAGVGVLAVGFLSAALCLELVVPLGLPLATLMTGAVLVAVVFLLLFATRLLVLRRRTSSSTSTSSGSWLSAGDLGEMLGEEAGLWARQHPAGAMLAALLAGFVVGSSPKLRSKLLTLLH
jgi:hypothetical protein